MARGGSNRRSLEAFKATNAADFAGERAFVVFLEGVHPTLDDLGGDPLANFYFNLLEAFTDKFSLRYDLQRPLYALPDAAGRLREPCA